MHNIISTKTTSSIFLAALLALGTISTILSSVQAQPYYEDTYEPAYPSDNSYKSKDSSSTIVKKVNCNNINTNNNGVDVNLGLPSNDALVEAQAEDNEGQATTANEWGYGNEYKQKDNGFKFVCVNNNDNENNVVVVNETTPEPPIPPDTITCEECFEENLTPEQLAILVDVVEGEVIVTGFGTTTLANLAELCQLLAIFSEEEGINALNALIGMIGIIQPEQAVPQPVREEIIQCVLEALDIETNDTSGSLTPSNTNTDTSSFDINTAGGLASSFSSTIAQETEDSSALEKIEKLKQQWLNLLP